jgi:hypothetical protein
MRDDRGAFGYRPSQTRCVIEMGVRIHDVPYRLARNEPPRLCNHFCRSRFTLRAFDQHDVVAKIYGQRGVTGREDERAFAQLLGVESRERDPVGQWRRKVLCDDDLPTCLGAREPQIEHRVLAGLLHDSRRQSPLTRRQPADER